MLRSQRQCDKAGPGTWGAGENLWLQKRILANGKLSSGSWLFRYANGKTHSMGLGPASKIPLTKARKLAWDQRLLLDDGIDPLANKRHEKQKKKTLFAIKVRDTRLETLLKNEPPWWKPGGAYKKWQQDIRRAKDAARKRRVRHAQRPRR